MENKSQSSNIKYFVYVRKSSEDKDRQVESHTGQLLSLKSIMKSHDVVDVIRDSKSAKSPDMRPNFTNMIKSIQAGDANGIICWKLDRLSRNPKESGLIQQLLQDGTIRSIITYDKEYKPDDNALLFSVESGISNQFIMDLRKNTLRGLRNKVDKGWVPIMAPQGYVNNKDTHTIDPDPERFSLIRQVWDMMLTGAYSAAEILDIANTKWGYRTRKFKRRGNKPMSESEIYRIFTNIFYTGMFEYQGAIHQGKHKPMITMSEYEKVQLLLGRNDRPRPQKHEFAFTGILKCPICGCSYTAETKTKLIKTTGKPQTYIYYHCTRKKKNIKCTLRKNFKVKDIEDRIDYKLSELTILPEFRDWALAILNRENDKEITDRNAIYATQQKALLETQTQLDNLTRMRYRDLISDNEYLDSKKELQDAIVQLKKQVKETEERAEQWMELTEKTFDFATYARIHFATDDLKKKRQILIDLGSNPILSTEELHIDLHKWLVPIKNEYKEIENEYLRLEPAKRADKSMDNPDLQAIFVKWGGFLSKFRTALLDNTNYIPKYPEFEKVLTF